ncbi:aldehyde dehydrogenase family protein [Roseateles saccharophilus]|uniref:NADP-dependent aldehyde dehydrogenase n=1 Tax=Roseateles saccharophilus TaxID=304 RepID=A0A4R3VF88_ROSSA|nr:aldehyde dehydrogenase family protein [Roseateles saccharophilus]MDG0833869.1 aldehyde dehydrogenase family protein [Roseateles saccharophilus]TCV02309.1 NADP-dependent aldehyde dehydrogenase [Roseateles saccharophilus]
MTTEPILLAGRWQAGTPFGQFRAVNPANGEALAPAFPRSGAADIEQMVAAAAQAADALAATPPERIAAFLEAYADAIDAAKDALVAGAHEETALPVAPRLADVELPRTTGQLRQAAQAVRSHAWTHPVIDTRAGLRSHFAPLHKPVLVLGPNNFPLAFNAVAGSDFASAIAARNPVIAKAHPSHPATSRRLAELAHVAALASGLPAATVQMFYDVEPALGLRLAGDRRIGAIGFTGSRGAGLALKAAADASGIPIYAEMSSVNPVFLLPGALRERGAALAQDFFASCTLGSGQFCTNPGIVLVPTGADGDAFVAQAAQKFAAAAPMVLFSAGVQGHLANAVQALRGAGARVAGGAADTAGPGSRYAPTLLEVDAASFLARAGALQQEAFGPVSLLVRFSGTDEAVALARSFDGNLTGTLHAAADGSDDAAWAAVAAALRPRVGRLIADKWPTGVSVSAAQQHGGPYPSTSHAGFSAVGMPGAIRRFAQLQSYDNLRDDRLPIELRDANPAGVQRCVDGLWTERALA